MKANTNKIRNRWLLYLNLILLSIVVSCQSETHLVLEPVGPSSSGSPSGKLSFVGTGFLVVYSATETRYAGKFDKSYPHTPYLIFSQDGKRLKWVENSTVASDEAPTVVRLPAGSYVVRAQDDDYGRVTVPVVIQDGQTTTVRLEMRGTRAVGQPDASRSVRLPDGRVVGWRAREPAAEPMK